LRGDELEREGIGLHYHQASQFLAEHDLCANAFPRLSCSGKTGLHPSGRGPRACFSGSCF
jgi:hypothetical protein